MATLMSPNALTHAQAFTAAVELHSQSRVLLVRSPKTVYVPMAIQPCLPDLTWICIL